MINRLILFSLHHRPLILGLAAATLIYSGFVSQQLPVDVLPDLTRPTVTLLTEAPGLAPKDVERLVTIPLENAVSGTPGVIRLRGESDLGLSLVFIEFDWGTDIYHARQQVQERLPQVNQVLPEGIRPTMGPISSLLGEILLIGLRSEDGSLSSLELRDFADRTMIRQLQSIRGVSQVLALGGGVRQLQILPHPEKMAIHGVRLEEIQKAAAEIASETPGGYLTSAEQELVIRNLGMTSDLSDFARAPVRLNSDGHPLLLEDVAEIRSGPAVMRGDAGVNGLPGVILSVQKAPGVDTLRLTRQVEEALAEIGPALPPQVTATVLFRQGDFIETAMQNLTEAVRDGAIMVAIVLFFFLLNVRTTLITLTAIPLSFAITLIVFHWFGLGFNTMTLGGIAVAIGMVVDDAIVDVENVFRRLRENRQRTIPQPVIQVVADASIEVRSAILYATLLIILVFLPLLALGGMEGQLFTPIALATIVSMLASFLIAVTLIPVLASLFLPLMKRMNHTREGFVVRGIKAFAERFLIRPALRYPFPVLGLTAVGVAATFSLWPLMGKSFLPAFNEGSATISMVSAPGTSLEFSQHLGRIGESFLLDMPEVASVGRRTGRAELDEHVMPVNVNEFDVEFHPHQRPRSEINQEMRARLQKIPGVFVSVGQPISHRIDHLLSGVEAQLAVKIYGPDLTVLRREAGRLESLMLETQGLTDVRVERQLNIPQLNIVPDRALLASYGLRVGEVNQWLSDALAGKTVGQLRDTQLPMDIVVRLPEEVRENTGQLANLLLDRPDGPPLRLGEIARLETVQAPNRINRENGSRRIIISANGDGSVNFIEAVNGLRDRARSLDLPPGYTLAFDGQYAAQRDSLRTIIWLASITLVAMTFLLYGYFRSATLVLQTLLNIPLACSGALLLTWLTIGEISLATLIGMIALAGIASRNTILMLSHYLHLMAKEGEPFNIEMIVRGTLERLVPVSMTALTAGIALLPLALSAEAPGKEILHPVAIAIIGGLITSTLLDLIVTPTVFFQYGNKATRQLA